MDSSTLTKAKLAATLAGQTQMKRQDALDLVENFFSTITDTLSRNENVKLSGFGHFQLSDKSGRPGLNLKTGARVDITPRRVVTFAASPKLKAQVESVEVTCKAQA